MVQVGAFAQAQPVLSYCYRNQALILKQAKIRNKMQLWSGACWSCGVG